MISIRIDPYEIDGVEMFLYFLFFQACSNQQSPEDFGISYCQLLDDCELLSSYDFVTIDDCINKISESPSIQEQEEEQQLECISVFNTTECALLYEEEGLGDCQPE